MRDLLISLEPWRAAATHPGLGLGGGRRVGPGSALAASPAGTRLRRHQGRSSSGLGWTQEPDKPQCVYRLPGHELRSLGDQTTRKLFGSGDRNQPTLDLASEFPTQQNGGISPDGKVWTIHMRSGVKFQDGTPLTASDVAFTYNYIIKNRWRTC